MNWTTHSIITAVDITVTRHPELVLTIVIHRTVVRSIADWVVSQIEDSVLGNQILVVLESDDEVAWSLVKRSC